MASSYLLTGIEPNDYETLTNLGGNSYTILPENLPIIWKACNGTGTFKGLDNWRMLPLTPSSPLLEPNSPMFIWAGIRSSVNGIIMSQLTQNVVYIICRSIRKELNRRSSKILLELCRRVHPSDWILVLCYVSLRMDYIIDDKEDLELRTFVTSLRKAANPRPRADEIQNESPLVPATQSDTAKDTIESDSPSGIFDPETLHDLDEIEENSR